MDRDVLLTAIRDIPLFSELRLDDLMLVLDSSAVSSYPKGTLLFQEGEQYRGFYVVLKGGVKVYKLSEEGRETLLHVLTPYQPLAEIPMFVGGGYPAHAEAIADSSLLLVHRDGFLALLMRNPELAIRMLAGLAKRLKTLGAQLEKLTTADVRTRLARWLIDELDRSGATGPVPTIVLPISKSLLAAQLGAALETLSRTFKKLEGEGLLRVHGRRIAVLDVKGLSAIR